MPDTSTTGEPTGEPWWDEPEPAAALDDDATQRWLVLLQTVTGVGFIHVDAANDRPWQRLTCPDCGDRLDLPPAEEPGWIRYVVRACRRVAVYVYRHRPAGGHR